MDYVRLGSTGLKVSRICLGMMTYGSPEWHPWTLDEAASKPFVRRALECGVNFFDTVDLYQIHRFDYETPIEETMSALDAIVRSGKARYIGASSMYAWQFAKMLYVADANGWTRFVSMQNHLNLIYREEEREMIPLCRAEGIGIIPYSPMARGFLAGDRKKGGGGDTTRANSDKLAARFYYEDLDFAIADRVGEVAKRRGVSRMQIALAWVLSRPGVAAPIVGASKLQHLDEAMAAVAVRLTADECTFLEELYQPQPVVGPL